MTTLISADPRTPPAFPVYARPTYAKLDHLPAVTLEQLLAAFSLALDLAEGRPKGHAMRVAYIAGTIARALDLPEAQRSSAVFAALLHDVGVCHASESLSELSREPEHTIFAASPLHSPEALAGSVNSRRIVDVVDAFHEHAFEGATAAAELGLPPYVAEAVLCHHERHDGTGFPLGLSGNDVPLIARIVAVADYAESLLSANVSPLVARRGLESALREQAGRAFHPQVAETLVAVARADAFWLDLHSHSLHVLLSGADLTDTHALGDDTVLRTVAAFADIVDGRSGYKRGHARRVATYATKLAAALGFTASHVRSVEVAALLHDLGMVRVPCRIISKPEILSVEEMQVLQLHPHESAEIVGAIPGWGAIAVWIAAHHERYDGRGYPAGLAMDEIPVESRILAVADVFAALTSRRPQREALPPAEALRVMRGMTGDNLDPTIFAAFERLA